MNPYTIQRLIRELAKGQFYEIIFVLLTVHREEPFMENLRQSMIEQLLIKEWEQGNEKEILQNLMDYFE